MVLEVFEEVLEEVPEEVLELVLEMWPLLFFLSNRLEQLTPMIHSFENSTCLHKKVLLRTCPVLNSVMISTRFLHLWTG